MQWQRMKYTHEGVHATLVKSLWIISGRDTVLSICKELLYGDLGEWDRGFLCITYNLRFIYRVEKLKASKTIQLL